jgi:hypothetical protein
LWVVKIPNSKVAPENFGGVASRKPENKVDLDPLWSDYPILIKFLWWCSDGQYRNLSYRLIVWQ